MKLIDTHTHLYDKAFDDDRDDVLRRASEAGVVKMMCPTIDSQYHERLFNLCRDYPLRCFPMMGLHPTSVNDNPDWKSELQIVEKYLAAPPVDKFYAIGEVGLDLYWSRDWQKQQEEVFERQVELSLTYSLPLVIHTREAWPQMTEILGKFAGKGLRGIMHSFSGTLDDYNTIRSFGEFMFGVGGPVTYKKSLLPDIVAAIPLSDIVLETDSPYLPPAPYRGKRNESSYVKYICEKVAEIKVLTPEEVAAVTTANAVKMFGLDDNDI